VIQTLIDTANAAKVIGILEPLICARAERLYGVNIFRRANLDQRVFYIHQPIVNESLKIVGFEMLARIKKKRNHEAHEGKCQSRRQTDFFDTTLWIPHVVKSHDSILLAHLGIKHLKDVLERNKEFHGYISINMNVIDLMNDEVLALLKNAGAAYPQRIAVELTEWRNPMIHGLLRSRLEELQHHHIMIAIDDFGEGYSSIKTVRSMKFDIIKIDAAIINSTLKSDMEFIEWIKSRALDMTAKVVAEGIETKEIFERIQEHGVDAMQGWYIDEILAKRNLKD